ncbi:MULTISPECIES: LLM class flavin-dependent oxidoreductase [Gordonia]|uniref:LLM class flavin-dependent oxidoreductase n=1 Tax=Gordonia amicalis TaxID=89053 RepID=A0AAE4R3L6_9ACTN|nr:MULTISPECIES: LLM class flavin-dependent oxidoreductase [Gordonia]ATD71049.1 LLM class flavin-dependent oxidoreductase [Gordonia sp. 1D]KAF0969793.1 Nitrilotriacetate monooxygenase component A [Gordonia sp. YY1]MCZ0912995.1 LLM class flavin-dependent oxidoreductase [Gordonia amicalis]MCZ4653400.1 LLM class flavin-dependent oxidoreductase [Gordonia amicalis]MDJ0453149.1 LLM class flavin-dependent oxidoreductase [Gordonia amicalis]
MADRRQMNLNLFILSSGHHEAAWRHPASTPERMFEPDFYLGLARAAEAATLDAVFLADIPKLDANIEFNAAGRLDPLLTLATVAGGTERIGLIATASTTYSYPWQLARALSTLDHLSRGRAAWNIVTTDSPDAARNFGLNGNPDAALRYERAEAFVEAVEALWDSWDDDAVVLDRAAGWYVDPSRIHHPNIAGPHLKVAGALTTPRPPQGHPVLVQAGSSDHGRVFAARHAEAIFTAQQRIEDAQAFYRDVKSRAFDLGRNPDHIKILPGLSPFIGGTEEEARRLEREFNELTIPAFGLMQLKDFAYVDLDDLDLDAPVPIEAFGDAGDVTNNKKSRTQVYADIVRREKPTLRQLLHKLAGARGHRVVAGTPEQVADTMTDWFHNRAADGFNVMPPFLPGGFDVFAETVVPILRRRGLFREGYEGMTLREHLGLPRPGKP